MTEKKGSITIDQILQAMERAGSAGNSGDTSHGRGYTGGPEFHRWFEKGVALLEDEDHEQAMAAFTRAIEVHPENPYTYANRARCYWNLGELSQAAGDLMETLVRDPGDLETLVSLGEVLTQDERHDDGIRVLRTALARLKEADPEIRRLVRQRAFYHLGLAQLAVNDLDNALGNASQALLVGPESPFVYDLLGSIRLGLGDHESALNDLDKAITLEKNDADLYVSRSRIHLAAGDDRRAGADLQKAVALASGDADAAVALGFELMDLEDSRWALESFSNAIRLSPDNAEAWYCRASLTLDKNLQAAYDDIQQALALDPEMADAHMTRGYLLNRLGQPDAALSALKHGVDLAPMDADNQAMLGEAFLERQLFQEALTCFELAIKLDSQCDSAYAGRARLFDDLGDLDAALADVQIVLRRDPENIGALQLRGAVMLNRGKIEAATADFERALQHGGSDDRVHSLVGLALALIKKGAAAEASARLDEAGRIDPQEAEVHYARAALDESRGDYDAAARHIEPALQADDSDVRYHELHGDILAGKGDILAARAAYETALRLAVSRRDKETLRDRIAEL